MARTHTSRTLLLALVTTNVPLRYFMNIDQIAEEAAKEIDDRVREYESGMHDWAIVEQIIKAACQKAYQQGWQEGLAAAELKPRMKAKK